MLEQKSNTEVIITRRRACMGVEAIQTFQSSAEKFDLKNAAMYAQAGVVFSPGLMRGNAKPDVWATKQDLKV